MIRTLFVGAGVSVQAFHYPFIYTQEAYQPIGLVRSRQQAVESIDLPVFIDLSQAIAQTRAELVIIGTPNHLHKEQALTALKAGAHVVVDKPLATNLGDAEELFQLANEKGRILCAYQNRRWDADFLTIRKIIDKGMIGRVTRFRSRFDRYRPIPKTGWKEEDHAGSGIWFDLGPHLIDQALVLFGKPEAITASLRKEREGVITDDAFDVCLYYPDTYLEIGASALIAARLPRFEVLGEKGGYITYGLDPQEAALRAGILPTAAGFGQETEEAYGDLSKAEGSAIISTKLPSEPGKYAAFYEQLAQAILKGKEPPVAKEDTLLQVQILEAAERSQGNKISIT